MGSSGELAGSGRGRGVIAIVAVSMVYVGEQRRSLILSRSSSQWGAYCAGSDEWWLGDIPSSRAARVGELENSKGIRLTDLIFAAEAAGAYTHVCDDDEVCCVCGCVQVRGLAMVVDGNRRRGGGQESDGSAKGAMIGYTHY